MTRPQRYDRYHRGSTGEADLKDPRPPGARDRDRILYAPAFRRLANITQVMPPAQGVVVHNRLTHTLKVAQLARRMAEALRQRQPSHAAAVELDPEVAEAAALAHDLGHPPFGHIAEDTLCKQLDKSPGFREGFEGNAQSFRIVTVLEEHPGTPIGLDLTRATLDALLKYPWLRGASGARGKKWGAYASEEEGLAWVRQTHPIGDQNKSVEAELMDWADDIAYSVHDLEDFFRAGMIPLDRLKVQGSEERGAFEESAIANIIERDARWASHKEDLRNGFNRIALLTPFDRPFDDSKETRERLHEFSSGLITAYLSAITLSEPKPGDQVVTIDEMAKAEVLMLKQLTWQYVIDNPALAVEQQGQRQIIEKLFDIYSQAVGDKKTAKLLPMAWGERLQSAPTESARLRLVADFIASLTERQALRLAGRLVGHQPTSILEMAGL